MATSTYFSERPNGLTKTISITSGKGGVGKTTLVANMAYALMMDGKKVLILDGDLGMANVDLMFGIRAKYSIADVLSGAKTISEILVEVLPGVYLIPGGSGIYEIHRLNSIQKQILLDQISTLEGMFDYMLIDTAPGIDDSVLYFNAAANETVVVLTPDPSSLTDSYALIKLLNMKYKETRFSVVCNMVRDEKEAIACFKRLSDVASKFLNISLDYKGFIPLDLNLRRANKNQSLVLKASPKTVSSFALKSLSEKLCSFNNIEEAKGGIQFFWQQLVGVA